MDESTEQFSAWWDEQEYERQLKNMVPIMRTRIRMNMLKAWQASRAAIEVEFPDKVFVEDEFDNGHNCAIDYCAESITSLGLKVKP